MYQESLLCISFLQISISCQGLYLGRGDVSGISKTKNAVTKTPLAWFPAETSMCSSFMHEVATWWQLILLTLQVIKTILQQSFFCAHHNNSPLLPGHCPCLTTGVSQPLKPKILCLAGEQCTGLQKNPSIADTVRKLFGPKKFSFIARCP